jgi:hypothetical protein
MPVIRLRKISSMEAGKACYSNRLTFRFGFCIGAVEGEGIGGIDGVGGVAALRHRLVLTLP